MLDKEFRKNFPWSLYWLPTFRPFFDFVWQHTRMMGWVWPFMFSAGALFFTNINGPDPLFWRSFSSTNPTMLATFSKWNFGQYSNHHFLNLCIMAVLCYSMAYYFFKTEHGRGLLGYMRYGLIATYAGVLVWTVHEGMWWITYIVASPYFYHVALQSKWFTGFGELMSLALLVFTPVLGLYAPKKFILWMAGFYVIWFGVGFPVTESYVGNTSWYNTVWGDGWEVLSWIWAAAGFYILERKGLRNWTLSMKALLTTHSQIKPTVSPIRLTDL